MASSRCYERFASEQLRLDSFNTWPRNAPISPRDLAAAGFFYTKVADRVRCYSCLLSIGTWRQGDDPWIEHIVWGSPRCLFFSETDSTNIPLPHSRAIYLEKATQQYCNNIRLSRHTIFGSSISFNASRVSNISNRPTASNNHIMPPLQVLHDYGGLLDSNLIPERSETSRPRASTPPTTTDAPRDERLLCKICFVEEIKVLFLPCRHLAVCQRCSERLNTCSICRKCIGWKINIFFA